MASPYRNIEFTAYDGIILRGRFYSAQPKAPVVIMHHGLGGLMEFMLDDHAERFQSAGIAVLLYDVRNWGISDGTPRQETDPWKQAEDVHDAISFAERLNPEIDPQRIALWGTSYSAGNVVIAAAIDPRVKCVITQVPFTSGELFTPSLPEQLVQAIFANRVYGSEPEYIPLWIDDLELAKSDSPHKPMLGTVESYEVHQEMKERVKKSNLKWENKTTLQSFYHMMKFEPVKFIHRLAPRPLLIVLANQDSILDYKQQRTLFEKAYEGVELFEIDAGHFGAYSGPSFEINTKRQIDFLVQNL